MQPDVVGATPGWFLKQYSLGSLWLRSTRATREVVRRAELRVRGCDDEVVFTEELNWGAGSNASTLPCCHSTCLAAQLTTHPLVKRVPATSRVACASDDEPPLAPPPPNASRHGWADPNRRNGTKRYGTSRAGAPLVQLAWRPAEYNTLAIPMHRFGRCTGRDVSCVGLHAHCPPPPPPFTRETALAGKRAEAEKARLRGLRHRAERAERATKSRARATAG